MGDLGTNLLIGIETAFQLHNLLFCTLGVLLGTLIGVLPGIGALAAISMLFPLTFQLDATTALIMLAGIWYGASYGGATTSIMLNVPGTATNAITAIDGHPLAKSGRAGVALFMATIASFCGGTIGIIFMMVFAPVVAIYANDFGPAEYFALMLLGLVAASTMSDGKPQKGYAMVCLGLFLGTIGLDLNSGAARFQFGMLELTEGIELAALAMGLFGIPEIIASLRVGRQRAPLRDKVTFRSMVPARKDWHHFPKAMGRGSGMGVFFGTLPGTGPTIAAFLAYVAEKKLARDPSRFGKGAIEGVVAPESANNAGDMTAFIPTLTLGIPGSATMAIMLGALMIHGITPGPTMMLDRPDVFWGLVMSFWIGNIMLLVINIPLLGLWVRMLSIPYKYLYPAILMFVCMGVYGIGNSTFDIWMVFAFGALGYLLRVLDFPLIPLLLGFVLGPPMEQNFRTAVVLFRGDMTRFLTEPISSVIMVLTLLIAVMGILPGLNRIIRKRRGRYDAV